MSAPIIIPDNCQGISLEINERQWDDLKAIANKPIGELCGDGDDSSLLVFPDVLGFRGDIDSEDSIIRIKEEKVYSGNLMGFIGRGDTMLKIRSRFDKDSNDFFMHYLLEKVFSINLINLPYQTSRESIFDFSLFLFPYFLKKALSQGIYREYVTYNRNDENLRGVIDISRHIQKNIPFTGKIAYRVREHTSDNPLLELIRHTIEYIREKDFGTSILSSDEDMKDSVAAVISATPTYSKSARLNTIIKNLRSRVHPYYSEYEPLRQLCLQILRQEGIKYGEENDKVYGVIFDGAWLWEAYLNTVLVKEGFHHPENRLGTDGIYMFADPEDDDEYDKYSKIMYPDFYRKNHILDAKYKHLNQGVGKEDLYQVITYMYCTQSEHGTYVYPFEKNVPNSKYRLNGYGGTIMVYPFYVPQFTGDWKVFNKEIFESEELLRIELGKSKLVKDEN